MANSNRPSDRNQYPNRNQYPDRNPNIPQDSNYPIPNDNRSIDESTVNTRSATRDEMAYRDGYVQGRNQEQFQEQVSRKRENDSAATGIVIGVVLASLAGLVAVTLYFSPRSQNIEQVPVPVPQSSPSPSSTTERTTIIERQPQIVPVPQQTQIIVPNPSQSNPTQPDTTQPSTIQPGTIQPSPAQPSTTQPDSSPTQSGTTQPEGMQPDASGTAPSQTSPTNSTGTDSAQ